jgi:hypothetical protein
MPSAGSGACTDALTHSGQARQRARSSHNEKRLALNRRTWRGTSEFRVAIGELVVEEMVGALRVLWVVGTTRPFRALRSPERPMGSVIAWKGAPVS